MLEKIQGLEEQIQFIGAKEKEIVAQKEIEVQRDVEMTKWKALTLV
jgi:hypothetical protein